MRNRGATRIYKGRDLPALVRRARAEAGPDAVVVTRGECLHGGFGGFFQQRCVELAVQPAGDAAAETAFSAVLEEAAERLTPDAFDVVADAPVAHARAADARFADAPVADAPVSDLGALRPELVERGLSWQLAGELVGVAEDARRYLPDASPWGLLAEALVRRIRVVIPPVGGQLVDLAGSLSLQAARAALGDALTPRPDGVALVLDELTELPGGAIAATLETRIPIALVIGADGAERLADGRELAALVLPEAR
jgi:hypothetical protein